MYIRSILIENVGPIDYFDFDFEFGPNGIPKPTVLVGQNGSGKTVALSHIVDALIEFAKTTFHNVVKGQDGLRTPYFKIVGGVNQKVGSEYGISLIDFSDDSDRMMYVDKSGKVSYSDYRGKFRNRFAGIIPWPEEGNYKAVQDDKAVAKSLFERGVVCFFPAERHEHPHWLNRDSIEDRSAFDYHARIADFLDRPIIAESTAAENWKWMLNVMLDARVGIEQEVDSDSGSVRIRAIDNTTAALMYRKTHFAIDQVLKLVLMRDDAAIVTSNRGYPDNRLAVALGNDAAIPSLNHLSSGQASLLNLFLTILRYADMGNLNMSADPNQVQGIVLVDEVEAQGHSDLQYETLPRLIKMFPKVQFVLTSHSPLFLLGMKREFGEDGFIVVDMPRGQVIGVERFAEFERSWRVYRTTTSFEQEVEKRISQSLRPIVIMEGETDPVYVQAALEVFERQDLAEKLDLDWIGTSGNRGSLGSGYGALDNMVKMIRANPNLVARRVLVIYDADVGRADMDEERVSVRTLPVNPANEVCEKGIENLLPNHVFEDRFYEVHHHPDGYGGGATTRKLNKRQLCNFVCGELRVPETFAAFQTVIEILDEFAANEVDV